MSTSRRDARRHAHERGTRVRLAVLVLVGLLLLAPHVGATGALLTETTVVTTVVSTQEVFPPGESGESSDGAPTATSEVPHPGSTVPPAG